MAKTKIKWNLAAFQQIRRTDEVKDMLYDVVEDILLGAGDGYEGGVTSGKTRLRGSVVTAEMEAIIDNSENQTLLRELSESGRGLD